MSDFSKAGDQSQNSSVRSSRRKTWTSPKLKAYGTVRDLTGGLSGSGGDGTAMNMSPSELVLKENVQRVGTHPAGIGLYLFDYKPEFRDQFGHERQFGVMVHEVEEILPEAISLGEHGYKLVDYAKLGIVRH